MADSNVLMPPDYLTRLISRWRPDSGIVSSPPIGSRPENFVAHLECAFLNTYQARWQYAAECVGYGFAQGKTMLYRRDVIEAGGGIEALGAEIAEDAASTKLIHRQGLHAHLVDRPFAQPIGPRRLRAVWKRQLRWARIRRECFPGHFGSEIITTSVFTLMAAAIGARDFRLGAGSALLLAALIWYGCEAALARAAGWPLSRWSLRCLARARSHVALALGEGLGRRSGRVARRPDRSVRRNSPPTQRNRSGRGSRESAADVDAAAERVWRPHSRGGPQK